MLDLSTVISDAATSSDHVFVLDNKENRALVTTIPLLDYAKRVARALNRATSRYEHKFIRDSASYLIYARTNGQQVTITQAQANFLNRLLR